MKNKQKKIIIIIAIIICIIIIVAICSYLFKYNNSSDYVETEFENDTSNIIISTELNNVDNRNRYYAVKNILGKYISSITEQGKESTYNMLNPEFISEFSVSTENVLENVESININDLSEEEYDNLEVTVNIDNMYSKESSVNITTYFIYGKFEYNIDLEPNDFSIIVETDSSNNTFYIYPSKYIQKYFKQTEDLEKYNTDIQEIEENDYNTFEFANVEDATVIMDYLSKYKNMLIEDVKKSYDMLDEEYREAKFENESEYEEFINNNKERILSISIKGYKTNKKDDYTEYVFIDQNNNYYVFKENYIMNYKVLLDYYTIDSTEYIKEYESADISNKVALNIQKITQALNVKDYDYIYDKLNDQFISNNYTSLEEFSNYMNKEFNDRYEVEYLNFEEKAGTYVQNIRLNSTSSDSTINVTVIMKLNEGTDFEFSFSLE